MAKRVSNIHLHWTLHQLILNKLCDVVAHEVMPLKCSQYGDMNVSNGRHILLIFHCMPGKHPRKLIVYIRYNRDVLHTITLPREKSKVCCEQWLRQVSCELWQMYLYTNSPRWSALSATALLVQYLELNKSLVGNPLLILSTTSVLYVTILRDKKKYIYI